MTTTQLKYFLALAETLNFTQVAKDFYVAQTSVTYSIQKLEAELGVKLFDRSTKQTRLTPGGHVFLEKARTAIALLERGKEEAASAMKSETIMIASSRLCSGEPFYASIHELQATHSNLQLLLSASEPEVDLFSDLMSGKIDIGVYISNPFTHLPEQAHFVTHRFSVELPRKLIVSKNHPYAKHKRGLSPDCLTKCQRITYGNLDNILLHTPSAKEVTQANTKPLIAKDFHSLIDMIGANLGVACLPLLSDLETETVSTIPVLIDYSLGIKKVGTLFAPAFFILSMLY